MVAQIHNFIIQTDRTLCKIVMKEICEREASNFSAASQATARDGSPPRCQAFPEHIAREIVFEMPDRLTDVDSWHGHIPFAFRIIEALRPRTQVELGTQKGDSYCALNQTVDRLGPDTACYAIDTWQGDEQTGTYGEDVFEDLRRYHEPRYGRFSSLIRATFDEAAKCFGQGSTDLLHIDGLHTYDAARHDFEIWLPKLSSRSVILLHDVNTRESDFGFWRLWNELVRDYPSFNFRHSHGLELLAVGADIEEPIRRLANYDGAESERVRVFFSRLGSAVAVHGELATKLIALAALEASSTAGSPRLPSLLRHCCK